MISLRSALVLTAAAYMLSGCDVFGPSAEVRYRITVEVNTPDGLRSGSGVWSFKLLPGTIDQSYTSRFRGEAIPIKLPHATLYALLDLSRREHPGDDEAPDESGAAMLPENVYRAHYLEPSSQTYPPEVGTSRIKQLDLINKKMAGPIKLDCRIPTSPVDGPPVSECPLLVVFRNPADPRSVAAVSAEDMTTTFGRGYSLRGIYLQITHDRPTHQVGKLPWENAIGGKHLDGSEANRPGSLPTRLTMLSFKRW